MRGRLNRLAFAGCPAPSSVSAFGRATFSREGRRAAPFNNLGLTMADGPKQDWRASLPFPAHWLWYIAAKLIVLALVGLIALKYYGLI